MPEGSRRILVWAVNYAPEPIGIAPLVTDACAWLAGRGHHVDVVTAFPNYPERRIRPGYEGALWRRETAGAVVVHRARLRVRPVEGFREKALYELTFAAASLPLALRRLRRADVVVAVVPTLLSSALATFLARRPRVVLWFQDLVLQGAAALDPPGPFARRLLRAGEAVERAAARAADRVVVCSPGFRDYLAARGVDEARIETIPNWVDTERITPVERPDGGGRPVVLYSGNLGYSQGFETLVEAARSAPELDVRIVGGGNAFEHVRALAADAGNVSLLPPVPDEAFPALLGAADIHVVLQRSVSAGANLPSKIAPYLASGRPIVASIDPATPAAELLRASGGALLVPPEQPAELAAALRRLADDPAARERLGRAGRAFAEAELARERILPRLERALLA